MNIVYLQCDARYNRWMLKEIDGKSIVEYTIDRCKKLKAEKILAGVFDSEENRNLIEILRKNNVEVEVSKEERVNKRFLEIVTREQADYCIRIAGDQPLIDEEEILKIIESMLSENAEWFYEEYINSIIPDIVSVDCLRRNKDELIDESRYFHGLSKLHNVKRYKMNKRLMIMYDFRTNSNEGFRVCSHVIKNNLNVYDISSAVALKLIKSRYLNATGLLGSWILPKKSADFYYDEDGNINPWLGRSVIDFLKKYLSKEMSVFEWGMGNSTLFWCKNVKDVVSIEYDKIWFDKIRKIIPQNAKVKYYDLEYDGDYCRAILEETKEFDIVFIDGRDRVRCAKNAVARLKEDGIIVWDNTDREYYREGYDYLERQGFKSIKISSIAYGSPGAEGCTTIFYRGQSFMKL